MSLDTQITDALEQAASGAKRRPGAWNDIDRRIRVSRRRRTISTGLAIVVSVTAGALVAPRLVRTIEPDQPQPARPAPTTVPGVIAKIPISAHALATTPEGVWALSGGDVKTRGWLYKIDPTSNRVAARIRVGINPLTVAVGDGSVWVINGEACGVFVPCPDGLPRQFKEEDYNSIWRIDPVNNKILEKIRYSAREIVFDGPRMWVFTGGAAELIDPNKSFDPLIASASVAAGGPGHIAIGRRFVWVTQGGDPSGFLSIIDPRTKELFEILDAPAAVAVPDVTVAFGSAWVSTSRAAGVGELVRVDPATRRPAAHIALTGAPAPGDDPAAVAAGNGYVWVLGARGYLWKIDPATNTALSPPARVSDGTSTRATAVVTGFGSVWATSADGFVWRMTP
jgi:hypothetical protein